jgi:hypothetical protein
MDDAITAIYCLREEFLKAYGLYINRLLGRPKGSSWPRCRKILATII